MTVTITITCSCGTSNTVDVENTEAVSCQSCTAPVVVPTVADVAAATDAAAPVADAAVEAAPVADASNAQ